MKKLISLIFLILGFIIFNDILAEGMTKRKQGSGSLPNNRALAPSEFNPFEACNPQLFTGPPIHLNCLANPWVRYSASGVCDLSGILLTRNSPGACTITATFANYTKTLAINIMALQPQNITVTASPSTINTLGTTTLTPAGNQGAVTYAVTSGSCTVSGNIVTAGSSGGSCTITATAAAVEGYSAGSAITNVMVLQPQNITVTASPSTINTLGTTTLTPAGNQGAVTYAVTSGSCTVSGNTVTAGSSGGTCTITATAAAVSGYAPGTATTMITVNAILNQTITVTSNISTMFKRSGCNSVETATLTTTGNQCATPSVVYTTTGAGCSINGNLLTATTTSTSCSVTATQSACTGPNNQNYAAATSNTLTIPVSWRGTTQMTIASGTLRGTAANPARSQASAVSTTVTLNNGLRPYRINCRTADYRSNCSMIANDGSETVGAGSASNAKNSPQIYGGMNSTFTVKAWVLFPSPNTNWGGNIYYNIQDSCSNGTPYSVTASVYSQ